MKLQGLAFLLIVFRAIDLSAQDVPATRLQQIELQRMDKIPAAPPGKSGFFGRKFIGLERGVSAMLRARPVHLQVGGFPEELGLAFGPAFYWNNGTDQLRVRVWGAGSWSQAYQTGAILEAPRVAARHLGFALEASHLDAPQLGYWGTGPDSSSENPSTFRREDTWFNVRAAWDANAVFRPECGVGWLQVNVGPGKDSRFPSSETVFSAAEAPGIDFQSGYRVAGCSAVLTFLDYPEDPHQGARFAAGWRRFHATDQARFSFDRAFASAEQYVPLLNGKRVLALREQAELAYRAADHVVPFYMQSTLGGSNTLRGFPRFRFHGENAVAFDAEYRWEIGTGFDMALFADAGKVFDRPGLIDVSHLQTSAGFGLRLKDESRVVLWLDMGFSREGVHLWLTLADLF